MYMSTTSRTWFYSKPEPRPYYIEERVNHSLWNNRLQSVFMSCIQAEKVIKMEGNYNGQPIRFEFIPGNYFVLRMGEENREVIGVMRQVLLGLKPNFAYIDTDGLFSVEYHMDGGEDKWRELQGNPHYQGLRRIS
ncbi:hypothetical protein MASR2M15_21330 [Anaerolineales bacterium]